jgi:hypothetical protein
MGKNTNYSPRQSSRSTPKVPHDIWRGLGCLMILIVPAISIAAGYGTIKYATDNKWPLPYQLVAPVHLPNVFYSTPGLRAIFNPLSNIPNFYANVAASLLYMMLISGVISVIYATIYRMIGPERYGPTDAPPSRTKVTKKSR